MYTNFLKFAPVKICWLTTKTIKIINAPSIPAFEEEQLTMYEQTTMVSQIRNSQYRHSYHDIFITLKINFA